MKIGIVGYQGSGKSTLFHWLTEVQPDASLAHVSQSAMAPAPDPRVKDLCNLFEPKKVTLASLELVDTPGLSPSQESNAARLALIREAKCLVIVVAGFDGSDPAATLNRFDDDMLFADMEVVTHRIEKLRELVKKSRPSREQDQAELDALEPILTQLEAGTRFSEMELSDEQIRATRSFQPLTEKPSLAIINASDDEEDLTRFNSLATSDRPLVAIPLRMALELAEMEEQDRLEFEEEMGLTGFDRAGLLLKILDASAQMLFFTASDKEVRTWLLRRGGTALDAADGIHSDLARGFIRAETMSCDDLLRLGSEREVKAQSLMRQESKDYVVQDGDILHIRFNV